MRKELIWAIIAGLALGVIIAFGVARINLTSKKSGGATQANPTPTPLHQTGLTIAKPNNDDVFTSSSATLSGLSAPNSWVIVSDDAADYLFKTGPDGIFDGEVSLNGGVNLFVITAVGKNLPPGSQALRLVFSSQLKVPEPASTPTSSESTGEAKALQKIKEVLNAPRAYFGTVTDITDTGIQLKSDKGEILQAAVDAKSVVVIKTEPKVTTVKFTDIAIGDYLAALGTTGGNHVLSTQRILITSPTKPPAIKVYFGQVQSVAKKEITLEEIKFVTKLSGVRVGDWVIVVGEVDEKGKFTPRKSFLAEPAIASPTPSP